jgi:hypothetical protein
MQTQTTIKAGARVELVHDGNGDYAEGLLGIVDRKITHPDGSEYYYIVWDNDGGIPSGPWEIGDIKAVQQ